MNARTPRNWRSLPHGTRSDDAFTAENNYRTQAHQLQQDARTAAQQGDAAKADDLNRQAANAAARSDEAAARVAQAEREVSDATVEVAESTKALSEAGGELRSRVIDPMEATTQISLMEDKAKLLDDASRKLELAPTIDNPVDRAQLELDAEKMIRDANGIQVITSDITKVTGQELQLPDVNALPTDAPPTDDTSLMDPNADDVSSIDPSAAGTSGQTGDQLAAMPATGGDTQDAGQAVAASETASASTSLVDPLGADLGTAPATTATDTTPSVDTGSEVAAAAAPLDDPLGVDSGAAAPTAVPDPAPAMDMTSTVGGTDGDGATVDVGFGDGADAAPAPVDFNAPDPAADATAFASDPGTDFGAATVPDDSVSDDSSI